MNQSPERLHLAFQRLLIIDIRIVRRSCSTSAVPIPCPPPAHARGRSAGRVGPAPERSTTRPPGARCSSTTCGWWCLSPAVRKYRHSAGGPHLHRHHRADQGGGHLRRGKEDQDGHLRQPLHRKRNPDVFAQDLQAAPGGELWMSRLKTDWDGNELLLSDVLGTRPDTVSVNLDQEIERENPARCAGASGRGGKSASSCCALGWAASASAPRRKSPTCWAFPRATSRGWKRRILSRLHTELKRIG